MGRRRTAGLLASSKRAEIGLCARKKKSLFVDQKSLTGCMTANDRERARMRVLSKAFKHLKDTLPWVPADTKLSKLDTLRMACYYIDHLGKVLGGGGENIKSSKETTATTMKRELHRCSDTDVIGQMDSDTFIEPVNLTWPFGFGHYSPSTRDSRHHDSTKMSQQQQQPRSRSPSVGTSDDESHADSG